MGELANMVIQNYIPHPWLFPLTQADLKKAKSLLTVIPVKNWNPKKLGRNKFLKKVIVGMHHRPIFLVLKVHKLILAQLLFYLMGILPQRCMTQNLTRVSITFGFSRL